MRILAAAAIVVALAVTPAGAAKEAALPGAAPFPAALAKRLRDAVAARGRDYEPRTRHRNPDGSPKWVNRLILEPSPYLLQHAHNPVNWYPWGDEAFEKARAEKKPILLSVGYSTCHWCHVMERESFEDEEIAEFLNRHYVAVKVDREHRPDVDAIYMAAVQSLTGGGGWPMTVWLTPDRRPFFGGTYFPPRDGDRGARVGFLTLLRRLNDAYHSNPGDVARSAAAITEHLERALVPEPATIPDEDLKDALRRAFDHAAATFDEQYGGFGPAPKFPRPAMLEFLLRYHRRTGEPRALEMVVRTLDAMARGGIRDHLGGGFHRYSTDAKWLVPHFEKMLYDNAELAIVYLEAFQASGEATFADVAREILGYVEREMTSPEGAFWSAGDAESEGGEGRYFLWTAAEIDDALGQRASLFRALYGVTPDGNIEGRNVLHLAATAEAVAAGAGISPERFREEIAAARADLRGVRRKREPPLVDRKILVSWNGLMISAFARAAHVLGEKGYAERGARAASFLVDRVYDGKRLRRSWFDGRAAGTGYLDDYAFLARGLLDLFEATYDAKWLGRALALHEVIENRFRDPDGGGYFRAPDDGERILARDKPAYDGSEPSGNSVAVSNLVRLAELTDDDRHRARADAALRGLGSVLQRVPEAVPSLLAAVEFRMGRPRQIVLVRPRGGASAEPMLARLREVFLPSRVLVVGTDGELPPVEVRALLEQRTALRGALTAYVCEGRRCDLPTTDPEVFARQIRAAAAPPD